MTKEIFLHKNYFDTTIRSAKTGNRTENRNPGQPETFMTVESVYHYKYSCIKIFSIQPSEVQKPETGQKTGSRTKNFFPQKLQNSMISLIVQ